jgi:hypothetical protein
MTWRAETITGNQMERDERASQPPAKPEPEQAPQERRGDRPGKEPGESPGPRGNPETDEEALRHRQLERERQDDDPN